MAPAIIAHYLDFARLAMCAAALAVAALAAGAAASSVDLTARRLHRRSGQAGCRLRSLCSFCFSLRRAFRRCRRLITYLTC